MSAITTTEAQPLKRHPLGLKDAQTLLLFADPPADLPTAPRLTRRRLRVRERPNILPFPDAADTQLALFKRVRDERLAFRMMVYCEDTIEQALKILRDQRFNTAYRKRILMWIGAPLVPLTELRDKFSFQAVCLMAGFAEPEIIRDRVMQDFASEYTISSVNGSTPKRR